MEHEQEQSSQALDPFALAADRSLESDDEEKQTFVERGNCNTARGQAGTRWS